MRLKYIYRRRLNHAREMHIKSEAGETLSPGDPMRLTLFTDYSMRVLLYLGARPEKLCSIAEVTRAYGISRRIM